MLRVGLPQELRKGGLLFFSYTASGKRCSRIGGRAMAYPGQVVTDPVTGTRIAVLKTSVESGGKLLQFEETYPPGRGKEANAPHLHLSFDERFEIVEGRAAYVLNGAE